MTPPNPPVQNPVDIPFENGIILTTTINLITCRQPIQCDPCEVIIDLGISESGSAIHKHRGHEPCKKSGNSIKFTITSNCHYHYEYKMQQFLPKICHAPTSQFTVSFAPCHSQGTHRPSGNIMLCVIVLVSIPVMVSFQEFLKSYW